MVSPAIPPTVQEIPSPLRGQYEDPLKPLFPQGNPAQRRILVGMRHVVLVCASRGARCSPPIRARCLTFAPELTARLAAKCVVGRRALLHHSLNHPCPVFSNGSFETRDRTADVFTSTTR